MTDINKYKHVDFNGCWIWKGPFNRKTPVIYIENKQVNIKKLLWFEKTGVKWTQKFVNTKCGKPLCVSPQCYETTWDKLLKKSCRTAEGCLLWQGRQTPAGYGAYSTEIFATKLVHKISYVLHHGLKVIPFENENEEILHIRHLCGKRTCFEPSHLLLGTVVENASDRIRHGTAMRGEQHPRATITLKSAEKIRESKYQKTHPQYQTQTQRATTFGVSKSIIMHIDNEDRWFDTKNKRLKHNEQQRIRSRVAKLKEWTENMYTEAWNRILQKSIVEDTPNEYVGTSCRIWLGKPTPNGYGTLAIYGVRKDAHVLSCEIKERRKLPQKMYTLHKCGNRLCVEPSHLYFGSAQENSVDTLKHGRHNHSKLTEEQVREIRATWNTDNLTLEQRALKFNVGTSCLRAIKANRTWKHVI